MKLMILQAMDMNLTEMENKLMMTEEVKTDAQKEADGEVAYPSPKEKCLCNFHMFDGIIK